MRSATGRRKIDTEKLVPKNFKYIFLCILRQLFLLFPISGGKAPDNDPNYDTSLILTSGAEERS